MHCSRYVARIALLSLCTSTAVFAEDDVNVLRNRVYIERDSGPLEMDVYLPAGSGPFPGVLVVHGGAWTIGTRSQLGSAARMLAEHGYTAAAISYRLAPKHPFPAQVYDCQAAVRWLRTHSTEIKLDPDHIGGYGYSAGGHLVALLGALSDDEEREDGVPADAPSARLQVVVAGGAPCDFRPIPADNARLAYWLGGTQAEKPDAYRLASPAVFVTADDPPMLFFHGSNDNLVPIRSPRRMVELLSEVGVAAELYTVENKGHLETVFDQAALERSLAFVDRYLKNGRSAESEDAPAHAETSSIPASRAVPGPGTSASLPRESGSTDGQ